MAGVDNESLFKLLTDQVSLGRDCLSLSLHGLGPFYSTCGAQALSRRSLLHAKNIVEILVGLVEARPKRIQRLRRREARGALYL